MKKTIISMTILASAFLSFQMNAQLNEDFNDRLVIGLKGGVNSSNVYDEQGEDFEGDAKLGFAAGGFIGIPLGRFLGIQPEILYSQKGYKTSGTVLLQSYTMTRTTNHLDIPIQLQVKPVPFLTILAGPQFSYLLSSKNEVNINGNAGVVSENDFDNDNPRKNMLGFVGGVDINISRLVIGGRLGWDFQDNKGDGTSTDPRYKNNWVQLTAGLRF